MCNYDLSNWLPLRTVCMAEWLSGCDLADWLVWQWTCESQTTALHIAKLRVAPPSRSDQHISARWTSAWKAVYTPDTSPQINFYTYDLNTIFRGVDSNDSVILFCLICDSCHYKFHVNYCSLGCQPCSYGIVSLCNLAKWFSILQNCISMKH